MGEPPMLGPPRRLRQWRHDRLRGDAVAGAAPLPIEVLADRVHEAAAAWGGPRRMVWLDPGGPMSGPDAEGVLTAFPFEVRRYPGDAETLPELMDRLVDPSDDVAQGAAGLRFTGGWLGYLAYEAAAELEPVRLHARRDLRVPLASWALHPVWFRHLPGQGILELWTRFRGDPEETPDGRPLPSLAAWVHWAEEALRAPYDNTTPMLVFPHHLVARDPAAPTGSDALVQAAERSFSKARFEGAVGVVQEAIRDGEVFQANLAHRLRLDTDARPFRVHLRLRRLNPSPFAAYLEEEWGTLVSNSPERLFTIRDRSEGRVVEARPIAGTRPRHRDPQADRLEVEALLASEKERAEHTMLVDLVRNDIGRIAVAGTVQVDAFQVVEAYSHVHHIVSNVRALLRSGTRVSEALRALFPGGTITGAPKLRSMEVIDRVEPVARGPYTGSLGYVNADGTLDLNILIRTMVFAEGQVSVYAGAGIVADSDPGTEYAETVHKASAMLAALAAAAGVQTDGSDAGPTLEVRP